MPAVPLEIYWHSDDHPQQLGLLLSDEAQPLCTFHPILFFLRSFFNLWGEATHNPFCMKNSSSEKDKVKQWRNKTQSLLRLHWKDFLYDFCNFFFFLEKWRRAWGIFVLSVILLSCLLSLISHHREHSSCSISLQ